MFHWRHRHFPFGIMTVPWSIRDLVVTNCKRKSWNLRDIINKNIQLYIDYNRLQRTLRNFIIGYIVRHISTNDRKTYNWENFATKGKKTIANSAAQQITWNTLRISFSKYIAIIEECWLWTESANITVDFYKACYTRVTG